MGLTEKGRQALRDAADPTLPHSYDWHVIEHKKPAVLKRLPSRFRKMARN